MATFEEVDAGLEFMNKKIEKHVPSMFQSQFSEEARLSFVLGILDAAERVRNKKPQVEEPEEPAA